MSLFCVAQSRFWWISIAGTRNFDPEKLASAITPKTKVILPVHFAGLPVDLAPVYALAEKHGLRVLEDAAHSIGADYREKKFAVKGIPRFSVFIPTRI